MDQSKNKILHVIGTVKKKEWIDWTKNYKITLARKNIFFFTRRGSKIKEQLSDLEQNQKYLFKLKESSKYLFLVDYKYFLDNQLYELIKKVQQQSEENLLRLQEIYRFTEEAYWKIQSKITSGQELNPLEMQQKELLIKLADLFSIEIF